MWGGAGLEAAWQAVCAGHALQGAAQPRKCYPCGGQDAAQLLEHWLHQHDATPSLHHPGMVVTPDNHAGWVQKLDTAMQRFESKGFEVTSMLCRPKQEHTHGR